MVNNFLSSTKFVGMSFLPTVCTLLGRVFLFTISSTSVVGVVAMMLPMVTALLMVLRPLSIAAGVSCLKGKGVKSAQYILVHMDGFPLAKTSMYLRFFECWFRVQL